MTDKQKEQVAAQAAYDAAKTLQNYWPWSIWSTGPNSKRRPMREIRIGHFLQNIQFRVIFIANAGR
ncbi:MAG: hypothetical protein IPK98_03115 [Chloracidobacterium sp.]|nr:hypothetical protein [Chloracidobacterium sp.]